MSAADGGAVPVCDGELTTVFASCPGSGRVILAISGGADSTALLVLAHRWRARLAEGPELVAATVDHGLRRESRAEAERVGALALRLGVRHELLSWSGAKPATGVEAAARNARRALLADLAKVIDADHIATAHTLDDQAETVLMRLAAGSGPTGLAAMRPVEERHGLTLLRPFLGIRKQRLVATLERDDIAWSEDAMNGDPRFARPRLRAARAALAREGLTPERLARLAQRMARYEDVVAVGAQAAREMARHPERPARLDGSALIEMPEELALRVLGVEIAEVSRAEGDQALPIKLQRLEALWEDLRSAIVQGHVFRRTLAGASIAADRDRSILVTRAPPRQIFPSTGVLALEDQVFPSMDTRRGSASAGKRGKRPFTKP